MCVWYEEKLLSCHFFFFVNSFFTLSEKKYGWKAYSDIFQRVTRFTLSSLRENVSLELRRVSSVVLDVVESTVYGTVGDMFEIVEKCVVGIGLETNLSNLAVRIVQTERID